MALPRRTSGGKTAASPSTTSPPSVGPPWDPNSGSGACFSDVAAVLLVLVGLCRHYAARVLLRCLDRRRRAALEEAAHEAQEPKPPSDADTDGASASPVAAGAWAEAECAICLAELEPEGGERVRVLPACGHGFHAACVEAWLATRASCPTCRAPSSSRSRPPPRTTRESHSH